MKNILIITIGTRDIQIPTNQDFTSPLSLVDTPKGKSLVVGDKKIMLSYNPAYPDFYTLNPRLSGEIILADFALFAPHLSLPLITPVLSYLKEKNIAINRIILVFTDQEKEFQMGNIQAFHYNNDTCFFAEIIEKCLKKEAYFEHTIFDSYGVFEAVNSYDKQYALFDKAKNSLIDEDAIETVYLLPQGGIDAINQSLTLRLIEIYKNKLVQLQKSEHADVIASHFPAKFLNTLNRQKIQKHLQDYAFQLIDSSLISDKQVLHLCQYARKRLILKHNDLQVHLSFLKKNGINLALPDADDLIKDLYCAAKIAAIQKSWGEFLWKMFTLSENFLKYFLKTRMPNIENYWKPDYYSTHNDNPEWVSAINRLRSGLANDIKRKGIYLNNPSRKSYYAIYEEITPNNLQKQQVLAICEAMEGLAKLRNGIAHGLRSVEKNDIENELQRQGTSIEKLCQNIDEVLAIQGLGIFDEIKNKIQLAVNG